MMQIEINKKYLGHFDGYVKLMYYAAASTSVCVSYLQPCN